MRIAYLTNCFPSPLESYVMEEISGLRAIGVEVLASSARRPAQLTPDLRQWGRQTLYLQAPRFRALLHSVIKMCFAFRELYPFLRRILLGPEPFPRRAKALVHTCLGVYYAVLLQNHEIDHIHVHHGYFSSWVAMVAARLLRISYSMTLHGSDLLVNPSYLDIKLETCNTCFTISEYNRVVILQRFPNVAREKLLLRRLGVGIPHAARDCTDIPTSEHRFVLLAAGRLHPVKNYSFLIAGCALLKERGMDFTCFIAGDGPERKRLEAQIRGLALQREIKLLGHIDREDLQAIYPLADLVVLTSKSEGIPVVLMEAMAHTRPVLAPNITGIPELVHDGRTGFLYQPGSLSDFVARVEFVHSSLNALGPLRRAAQEHVATHFNRAVNLEKFIKNLYTRLCARAPDENPVLQQI